MGVKGKKVRFCGLETISPHKAEEVGRAVLAKFDLQTALSYQSIAVLYGSSQNIDHARLIARFMEKTGFCEIRQKRFSQSMEVILNPKWQSWREAYKVWNDEWGTFKSKPKAKKDPIVGKRSAILKVIKGQGESTLETIFDHLRADKVEIELQDLIKALDWMAIHGKVMLVEKQRSTFYGPVKKKNKPKNTIKHQINVLNSRIARAKARKTDALGKLAAIDDEIERLSNLLGALKEQDDAQKKQLKGLQREAKQYQTAVTQKLEQEDVAA